jgi:ribosomal protein L37AE/L43A
MQSEDYENCPKCKYKMAILRTGSQGWLQFHACPRCDYVEIISLGMNPDSEAEEIKKDILETVKKEDQRMIHLGEERLRFFKPLNSNTIKIVDKEHEKFIDNVMLFEAIIKRELNFECLRCGMDIRDRIIKKEINIHLCDACRMDLIEREKRKYVPKGEWSYFFDYDPKIKKRMPFVIIRNTAYSLASNYQRKLYKNIRFTDRRRKDNDNTKRMR